MPTPANTTARGLGYRWQLLTRQAHKVYTPTCHICRQPIDETLPATHPMSWTLDHLDPRATHGTQTPNIERVRPAHRSCNTRRGKQPAARKAWRI